MKTSLGASGIFYLIVGLSLVAFFMLVPYPHYEPDTARWYLGASVGSRITGAGDPGVPLEKVFEKVTKAVVTSPLEINCLTNSDCTPYKVPNQCKSYCGNSNAQNQGAVTSLNNNRVCDPAITPTPKITCYCVHGNCTDLN